MRAILALCAVSSAHAFWIGFPGPGLEAEVVSAVFGAGTAFVATQLSPIGESIRKSVEGSEDDRELKIRSNNQLRGVHVSVVSPPYPSSLDHAISGYLDALHSGDNHGLMAHVRVIDECVSSMVPVGSDRVSRQSDLTGKAQYVTEVPHFVDMASADAMVVDESYAEAMKELNESCVPPKDMETTSENCVDASKNWVDMGSSVADTLEANLGSQPSTGDHFSIEDQPVVTDGTNSYVDAIREMCVAPIAPTAAAAAGTSDECVCAITTYLDAISMGETVPSPSATAAISSYFESIKGGEGGYPNRTGSGIISHSDLMSDAGERIGIVSYADSLSDSGGR